jgi:hypothetical protein
MKLFYLAFTALFIFNINSTAIETEHCDIIPLETLESISSFFSKQEIQELKDLVYTFDSVLLSDNDLTYNQAYLGFLLSLFYHADIYGYFPLDDLLPNISSVFNCVNGLDTNLYNKIFIKQKHLEPDSLGFYHEYLMSRNSGEYVDFIESLLIENPEIRKYYNLTQELGDCDGNLDCLYLLKDWNFNNEGVRLIFAVYVIVWYDID